MNGFPALSERFDIVGVDQRGTGGAAWIDCDADLQRIGPLGQPLARPDGLDAQELLRRLTAYNAGCVARNARILPHVSTANAARDLDRVRAALGGQRLHYPGWSYGSFLGATYQSLFPERVGRFVLDGGMNPDQCINDPVHNMRPQTKAFETALGRFFQACARNQTACFEFGGEDPWAAYDAFVAQCNASPLPGTAAEPRATDGDDVLVGTFGALYSKLRWRSIGSGLRRATEGNGRFVHILADAYYGRDPDGGFRPELDAHYAITSTENRWPRAGIDRYSRQAAEDFELFDHFWRNSGYFDLGQGLWPLRDDDAYYGPFRTPADAPTTLVIGTTFDPATPYRGTQQPVTQLRNARLVTMRGDGHTAYPGESACIDTAVEAYLRDGVLPAPNTVCVQKTTFGSTTPDPSAMPVGGLAKPLTR